MSAVDEPGRGAAPRGTSLLDPALNYASRGWRIFPCGPGRKRPAVRDGFHAATASVDQIRAWWTACQFCNIGAALPPGWLVVDVDPGHNGFESLDELQRRHGRLPGTLTVRTPSGGRHHYYESSARLRQTAGLLGDGIDTRTGGAGYVLLPPSRTEVGEYRWHRLAPLAPAPRWLVRALAPPPPRPLPVQPAGSDTAALARWVAARPEGERNAGLHWAACRVAEAGHDPEQLVAAAVAAGLPEREARATCRSAARGVRT